MSLGGGFYGSPASQIAYGQVTPDTTLGGNSSLVNNGITSSGVPAQLVNGGLQYDTNLFHSFAELSIAEAEALYFSNPASVDSIFTRVTGGNASTVLGTLGVDGPADLYLMNPAGVVFGNNATLDLQGSFFVTTGNAIAFADGSRFEAAGTGDNSLLTVSVPLGLRYQPRPTPGTAAIASTAANLMTPASLNFVADKISIRGGLSANGIHLHGDTIQLDGRLSTGNVNTLPPGDSGDITVLAQGQVDITGSLNTNSEAFNAGNIAIDAASMQIEDGARLRTETKGPGAAGNISLTARTGNLVLRDNVELLSETRGSGNGGNVDVIARSGTISITDNVEIRTGIRGGTRRGGTGNAGNITIQAATITFEEDVEIRAEAEGRSGQAGTIRVEALNGPLRLDDNVEIRTETEGRGDGGDIALIAQNDQVRIRDNVEIRAGVRRNGEGDAGDIHIQGNSIVLEGRGEKRKVEIRAESDGDSGNAGNILMEALGGDLTLRNDVVVWTNSQEDGDGGDITVRAPHGAAIFDDDITIISSVRSSGEGDAGDILVDAQSIIMENDVKIEARNESLGNGANITLRAQEEITLDGTSGSVGLFSSLEKNAVGEQAGDINLSGRSVYLIDATLQSNSLGRGNAGNVRVNAREIARFTDGTLVFSRINPGGIGTGGNLEITAPRVEVTDNSELTTGSSGQGDAGNVIIRTGYLWVSDDAEILATTFDIGNGGKIQIDAPGGVVRLENEGRLVSGAQGAALGNSGDIEINTGRLILVSGGRIITSTQGVIPSLLLAALEDLEYVELVQGDQPLVYWPLDETIGNQIRDASGNGLNGTVVGMVDLGASGVGNTGARFNGGTGSLVRSDTQTPPLNLKDRDFTVEAWVRPNANPSADQTFVSLFSSNDGDENFSVGLNRDGSIRVSFSSPRSNGRYRDTHTTSRGLIDFSDGDTWHHIVVTYETRSGGLTKVFLNGAAVTVRNLGGFEGESPILGVGDWQNVRGQGFNGTVDEVAIYDRLFDNDQIINHYLVGQQHVRTNNPILNNGGEARAGDISINAETVAIAGQSENGIRSGLLARTERPFSGDGGSINLRANTLSVTDRGIISAQSQGQGDAGQIAINLTGDLWLNNADIATASRQSSGGAIAITANAMRLLGDSDIRTDIASGQETGGNITLRAASIIALDDSDILAFSRDGQGGNITLDTPAFFGENFFAITNTLDPAALSALDGNGRVDINASGRITSGTIILPDVSLVQNTLTTLPDTLLNSEVLLAGSCVTQAQATDGIFVLSGLDGLPQTSANPYMDLYSLGTITALPSDPNAATATPDDASQFVEEPHQLYQLTDGRLVLSQDCSE